MIAIIKINYIQLLIRKNILDCILVLGMFDSPHLYRKKEKALIYKTLYTYGADEGSQTPVSALARPNSNR